MRVTFTNFTLDVQCKIGIFSIRDPDVLLHENRAVVHRETVKEFANIALVARRRLFALNNARA